MGWFSSVTNVVKKATNTVTKVATKTTSALQLDSLAKAANIKKLMTNPSGYAQGVATAAMKNVSFAQGVAQAISTGNVGYLAQQGGIMAATLTGNKQLATLGGKVSDAYNKANAVANIALQAKAGNIQGAANAAKALGGTIGQIGGAVSTAYGIAQDPGAALTAAARNALTGAATVTNGVKIPANTAIATARTPLGSASGMVAATTSSASLARAASPGAKGTTGTPIAWAQYKTRKETLGGLL